MRDIEFRGLNRKGKWFYGSYIETHIDAPAIVWGDGEQEEIKKETMGQFTGLRDKNGERIFEGDILAKDYDHNITEYGEVKYMECGYVLWFECDHDAWHFLQSPNDRHYIVGNIHENPELLT